MSLFNFFRINILLLAIISITFVLPIIVLITLFFVTQSRVLNLMLLGDDVAVTLGTDLLHYRHLYLVLSAMLVGLTVLHMLWSLFDRPAGDKAS